LEYGRCSEAILLVDDGGVQSKRALHVDTLQLGKIKIT
jgi:hypothetical protein